MPLVEATDTIRERVRKCSEASSASLIRSCAAMFTSITEFQRACVHVGQQLVPGDAGVVDHDVEPAVPLHGVVDDPLAGVLAR